MTFCTTYYVISLKGGSAVSLITSMLLCITRVKTFKQNLNTVFLYCFLDNPKGPSIPESQPKPSIQPTKLPGLLPVPGIPIVKPAQPKPAGIYIYVHRMQKITQE